MKRDGITGGAYVLVSRGRIVASRGFGLADLATRRRVNPDSTVFGLASTTKLFTSIAAARLAREGRLDLDAPIAPYLSGTALSRKVEGATISKLLTHTAGFDDATIGSSARSADAIAPLDRYLDAAITSPWIRPGVLTAYSNAGVALAGHVIAVAGGSRYHAIVDSAVFSPFGMRSASVAQPLPGAIEAVRAVAYTRSGSDQRPIPRIYFNDAPASAGFATPHDIGLLMSALVAPRTPGDSAVAATIFARRFTNHPALPGMTLGFRESADGVDIYEHGGDWQDYSNSLWLDRKSGTGLFAVFSSADGGQTAQDLWAIVKTTLPARPARYSFTRPAAGTSSPAGCANVAGTYRDTRMSRHTIAKLGALTGDVRELVVKSTPAGISLGGQTYREVGGGVFQSDAGRTIAFRCVDGGPPAFLFRSVAAGASYSRMGSIESRAAQLGLLLFAIVMTIIAVVTDIRRRRNRAAVLDSAARLTRVVAGVSVILLFVALLGLLVSTNPWEFQYGLPDTIANLQMAGIGVAVAAALAVLLSLVAVVTAKAKAGLMEAALAVPALLLVVLMIQWNLVVLAP